MTLRQMARRILRPSIIGLFVAFSLAAVTTVEAQDDTRFPGVELGLVYENSFSPTVALKQFTGRFGGMAAAGQVQGIIGRDLRYSDRYRVMDSIPAAMVGGDALDYSLWDQLGTSWLLTGSVEGAGNGGFVVVLELHDVLYSEVKEQGQFNVPSPNDAGFRMAVHRISDQIVEWISDEPGIAATRIAVPMRRPDGTKEIYLIDSDGENLHRLSNTQDIALSPSWSPDGRRLLFQSWLDGEDVIYEMELATRNLSQLGAVRDGQFIAPSYHPNGDVIAFSVEGGSRSGIYTYDIRKDCCLVNLTEGRQSDLSPVYSPDGNRIAFQSNRYGESVPQIFVMSARGNEPDLVSPYRFGEQGYYTSPDWSPRGDMVAFHGRLGRYGRFQILVAEVGNSSRVLQLTRQGNNEDPSWAPDGRHIVFVGVRDSGTGLYIVDSATGATRTLISGVDVTTPDWSPSLTGG